MWATIQFSAKCLLYLRYSDVPSDAAQRKKKIGLCKKGVSPRIMKLSSLQKVYLFLPTKYPFCRQSSTGKTTTIVFWIDLLLFFAPFRYFFLSRDCEV